MKKTVLVGESRDRRCNGVISERKMISSVIGPWDEGQREDLGRGGKIVEEGTDSDEVAKPNPTAENFLEAMSLDPVPPSRFHKAALKEGASEEKGGEK